MLVVASRTYSVHVVECTVCDWPRLLWRDGLVDAFSVVVKRCIKLHQVCWSDDAHAAILLNMPTIARKFSGWWVFRQRRWRAVLRRLYDVVGRHAELCFHRRRLCRRGRRVRHFDDGVDTHSAGESFCWVPPFPQRERRHDLMPVAASMLATWIEGVQDDNRGSYHGTRLSATSTLLKRPAAERPFRHRRWLPPTSTGASAILVQSSRAWVFTIGGGSGSVASNLDACE